MALAAFIIALVALLGVGFTFLVLLGHLAASPKSGD